MVKATTGRLDGVRNWLSGLFSTARQSVGKAAQTALMQLVLGAANLASWRDDKQAQALRFRGWNYVAINAIAKQASQATVVVSRRKQKGASDLYKRFRLAGKSYEEPEDETEPVPDHELAKLLRRPNPRTSQAKFLYQCAQQMHLCGAALVFIVFNTLGLPASLWIMPCGAVTPEGPSPEYPDGSYLVNNLSPGWSPIGGMLRIGPSQARADAKDCIYINLPDPLYPYDAASPTGAGATAIDIAEKIDEAQFYAFENGMEPSAVFTPTDMAADPAAVAAVLASVEAKFKGTKNHGKIMVGVPGTTFTPWGHTPDEMKYNDSAVAARNYVMAIHGVTPLAAGLTEPGAYAAYYAALAAFTTLCIQPLLCLVADELTYQLARWYQDGESLKVEIKPATIQDREELGVLRALAVEAKAVTKNEVRKWIGEPEHEDGDEFVGAEELAAQKEQAEATLQMKREQFSAKPKVGGSGAGGGLQPKRPTKKAPPARKSLDTGLEELFEPIEAPDRVTIGLLNGNGRH